MSKPRMKLVAVVDTEAHADTIISSVTAKLQGKDIFEQHNLLREQNESGEIEFVFDCRFNSRIERNDVLAWMRDQVRDHPVVKGWVLSAKLTAHLCTHDDPEVQDCLTTEYSVEFEK